MWRLGAALAAPWNGGGQVPERVEQDKQEDHSPGLQEKKLWPVWGSAWKNPMGHHPGAKRGPPRAGWFSRITSSNLKLCPSPKAGSQAQVAGSLHGWISSYWLNTNIRRKHTKVKAGTVEMQKQSKHAGMRLRKPKCIWCSIWWGML